MQTERRQHVRYISQKNAFAALSENYTKVGRIKNISMGGVAFEYIVGQRSCEGGSLVDVFLTDGSFHIYNLPCTVVYDAGASESHADRRPTEIFSIRRCAVRFEARSNEHKDQIRSFIRKHTIGRAQEKFRS